MSEKVAKKGDLVAVEYTGKLENGETFDTSKGKEPLEFEVGAHAVIKGFEDGVVGMKVGQEREIKISPAEGYGPRHEQYVKEVPKDALPKDMELKVGMALVFKREDDMRIPANIVKIEKEKIFVDFNHPLAGRNLIFTVKLVEIK